MFFIKFLKQKNKFEKNAGLGGKTIILICAVLLMFIIVFSVHMECNVDFSLQIFEKIGISLHIEKYEASPTHSPSLTPANDDG